MPTSFRPDPLPCMDYDLPLLILPIHYTTPLTLPKMIDDQGRQILLHGVNVIYKIPPFYPNLTSFTYDDSLAPTDMAFLRDNGLNVVRLFVSWAGTEPTPGAYNITYLQVRGCVAIYN